MEFENIENYLRNGWYISFNDKFIDPVNVTTLSRTAYRVVRSRFKKKVHIIKGARGNNPFEIKGDRVIHRKEDGNILLFDYEEKLLYRKWASKDQVGLVKSGMNTLEYFYNINPVEFFNDTISKEKLLPGTTLRNVSRERQIQVADQIFEKYYNAIAEGVYPIFSPRISPDVFIDAAMKTNYPKEMKEFLVTHQHRAMDLLSRLKWTWGHSDLTPDNIIVNSDTHKTIDIERCEILPWFYDISNFCIQSVLMCKNRTPLKSFLDKDKTNLFLDKIDKKLVIIISLILKRILAWDSKVKKNSDGLMNRRWAAIRNEII